MKNKLAVIITLFLLDTSIFGLWAQSAIPATGGNASGSGGSVSYTVGQVDYSAFSGANGTINQGVQQPFEFFLVGIEDIPGLSLYCSLYPNPANDHVVLNVTDSPLEKFRYELYDLDGRLIGSGNVTNVETIIPMGHLPAAVYFLVVCNNKAKQTFKIIKNQ